MSIELALAVAAAGLTVGVLSALLGVGGGIFMVPFMVVVLGETQHLAEGTSLLVIIPTALVGVIIHRRGDYVDLRSAILLAAGGMGGAYLGAAVALRLPGQTLQFLFGILMAFVGIRTTRKGLIKMRTKAE